MKRIFILSMLLIAASFLLISCGDMAANTNKPANTANNAPTNTGSASADADVKKLISDLSAALSKNDTAALDKLYADDYTLVTQTGEMFTKAQRLGAIKSGELKFENVAFSDVKVRAYGDTAVANANSKGKSTNKGKTSETSFRITFVANKSKDGWRMVSAHLSPMPEETKPDDSTNKDDSNKNTNSTTEKK